MDFLTRNERQRYGLPITEFLYTLDQIAFIIGVDDLQDIKTYVHFRGISKAQGQPTRESIARSQDRGTDEDQDTKAPAYKMVAIAVTPSSWARGTEWRVPERELKRFLYHRGAIVYERTVDTKPEAMPKPRSQES